MLIQIIAITCSYLGTDAEQRQCASRIVTCANNPVNLAKGQTGFSDCVYQEQLKELDQQMKKLSSGEAKESK